jgi:hypothetical protein
MPIIETECYFYNPTTKRFRDAGSGGFIRFALTEKEVRTLQEIRRSAAPSSNKEVGDFTVYQLEVGVDTSPARFNEIRVRGAVRCRDNAHVKENRAAHHIGTNITVDATQGTFELYFPVIDANGDSTGERLQTQGGLFWSMLEGEEE